MPLKKGTSKATLDSSCQQHRSVDLRDSLSVHVRPMLNGMAIGAQGLKIIKRLISSVSIFMVHYQRGGNIAGTPFATKSSYSLECGSVSSDSVGNYSGGGLHVNSRALAAAKAFSFPYPTAVCGSALKHLSAYLAGYVEFAGVAAESGIAGAHKTVFDKPLSASFAYQFRLASLGAALARAIDFPLSVCMVATAKLFPALRACVRFSPSISSHRRIVLYATK